MKKVLSIAVITAMMAMATLIGCVNEEAVLSVDNQNDGAKIEITATGNVTGYDSTTLSADELYTIEIVAEITYGAINIRINDESGETIYLDNIKGKAYPIEIGDVIGDCEVEISATGANGRAVIEAVPVE